MKRRLKRRLQIKVSAEPTNCEPFLCKLFYRSINSKSKKLFIKGLSQNEEFCVSPFLICLSYFAIFPSVQYITYLPVLLFHELPFETLLFHWFMVPLYVIFSSILQYENA